MAYNFSVNYNNGDVYDDQIMDYQFDLTQFTDSASGKIYDVSQGLFIYKNYHFQHLPNKGRLFDYHNSVWGLVTSTHGFFQPLNYPIGGNAVSTPPYVLGFKGEGEYNNHYTDSYVVNIILNASEKVFPYSSDPSYPDNVTINISLTVTNTAVNSGGSSLPIKYFFREDTKKIIVSDLAGSELPKNSLETPLFEKYGQKLINYSSSITNYSVRPGNNIPIRPDNALYLFYGHNSGSLGNIPYDDAWKYDRSHHKKYRIFVLTQTGSMVNGNPSTKVEKVYVDYNKSVPGNSNKGIFKFQTLPNTDVTVIVGATLKSYAVSASLPNSTSFTTWPTASLNLYKGDTNNMPGTLIAQKTISGSFNSSLSGVNINLLHNIPLNTLSINDILSYSLSVESGSNSPDIVQSGLVVTNYSFRLTASGSAQSSNDYMPVYFNNYNRFSKATDCHPNLNNVELSRPNGNLFELEYKGHILEGNQTSSYGILIPSNIDRVLDKTELPSDTNPFLYSSTGLKTSRYDGSLVYSKKINEYNDGDKNTYGKTPSIEVKKAYFAYYNSVHDLYPLVNNKSMFEIKYSVGPNGDVSSPIMDENSNINMLNSLTDKDGVGKLKIYADSSTNKEFKDLNGFQNVFNIGRKPYPVFYSQTSSKGYSKTLDLWGLKEMLGPQDYIEYSFIASGSDNVGTGNDKEIQSGQRSPDYVEYYDSTVGPASGVYNPSGIGTVILPTTDTSGSNDAGMGKPLSNQYTFNFEHHISTTYVNDIKWQKQKTQKKWIFWKKTITTSGTNEDVGYYELWLEGKGKESKNSYSPSNSNFSNNMVNKTYDLKNVKVIMNAHYKNPSAPNGYDTRAFDVTTSMSVIHKKNASFGNKTGMSVIITFNNDKIEYLLKSNGLSINDYRNNGSLQVLTWHIKGEIDDSIVQGSEIKLFTKGFFEAMEPIANQNPQNFFNPEGSIMSDNGVGLGSFNIFKLIGNETPESRTIDITPSGSKYWDYAKDGTSTLHNTLFLKVENANKAWGKNLKQVDLIYQPTASLEFQSGFEPPFISFPQLRHSWEPKEGDEIRFENSELNSYRIVIVEGPNTPNNNTNELKIILDRDIIPTTNLDFFLIRRYEDEKGVIIFNTKFPYGLVPAENNTQGLIFPEFITDDISKNPDIILKDLSSKGIIS